jgi:hypothetical protein
MVRKNNSASEEAYGTWKIYFDENDKIGKKGTSRKHLYWGTGKVKTLSSKKEQYGEILNFLQTYNPYSLHVLHPRSTLRIHTLFTTFYT